MPYTSLVQRACRASAAAYRSDEAGKDIWLLQDPLSDAQVRVALDAQGDAGDVIVAFRGSSSAMDWMHNAVALQTTLSPWTDVRVHAGFLHQYRSLHHRLAELLHSLDAKHLLLCGHSLGGALACVAAAMLLSSYTGDLVTFGAPRVGNARFAEVVRSRCVRITRVVHSRDVVPTAPLRLLGYEHVSPETAGGEWTLLAHDGSVRRMRKERSVLREACVRLCGVFAADLGVSDHFIAAYMTGVSDDVSSSERGVGPLARRTETSPAALPSIDPAAQAVREERVALAQPGPMAALKSTFCSQPLPEPVSEAPVPAPAPEPAPEPETVPEPEPAPDQEPTSEPNLQPALTEEAPAAEGVSEESNTEPTPTPKPTRRTRARQPKTQA